MIKVLFLNSCPLHVPLLWLVIFNSALSTCIFHIYCFFFIGSNLPSLEVQHSVSSEDRSGAGQPIRTAENVGRTAKSEQILPTAGYKG